MNDTRRELSRDRGEINITEESVYIIRKAQEHDCRVVTFGRVLLFSTQTGDAWLLDPDDGLALCLARDGVEQDYTLVDTTHDFQIHWSAQYDIRDEVFVVTTADGAVRSIIGYPTDELVRMSGPS